MKAHQIISSLLLILFSEIAIAQTGQGNCVIKYDYDMAGNRVKRFESCGGSSGNKMTNPNETQTLDEDETVNEPLAQLTDDDLDIAVLFPNPTSSNCIVSLNKPVSNATLSLYANQGKLVYSERINGKDLPLDLSGLSSGTYIVIVSTENKSVNKTVVKN